MESLLQEKLETTLQNPGIHGIVCTDMQGLCLGNQGAAFEELAGPIAALCEEAYKQWPSQDSPVIVLETTGPKSSADLSLLIKMSDGICTGIIKSKHN
ncbi:ragulator complex protein LAMTOR5-like [Clavelina lepadiformis]|uniref:Ragulator complex protein LAMTOR5 n=1 Tax=Clavelina lepadiformis TaxID=159417 RepID=A0ABP0H204_CLALP